MPLEKYEVKEKSQTFCVAEQNQHAQEYQLNVYSAHEVSQVHDEMQDIKTNKQKTCYNIIGITTSRIHLS